MTNAAGTEAKKPGRTLSEVPLIDPTARVTQSAAVDALDDRFGLTPAGWAEYCGHTELAQRLR